MSHRKVLAGALMATALIVVGCGSDDDASTSATTAAATSAPAQTAAQTTAAAKVAPKVAMITAVFSDYQEAQEAGLKEVVEANGGSYETFNANYDPQKQLQQCTDAINSGRFNAIVLGVLDPPSGVPCVKAAKAKGIPVVALNSAIGTDANDMEPQVDGVVGGIYSTPADNVARNIELLKKACEGVDPCKVVVELATPTDPMTNDVAAAITKDVPNAEVVAKFVSGFDPGVVAQKMPTILNAHPDTAAFMSIADSSALAALPAIKKAGLDGKVKLIGDGGSIAGVAALKDGTMFASTGAWPRQEGALVATMATKALNGEEIDPVGVGQHDIDTPVLLYQDTVDEFTPEWGAGR